MNIETRTIKVKNLKEIFISASASAGMEPKYQAQEIFRAVRDLLTAENAQILQERAFFGHKQISIVIYFSPSRGNFNRKTV